MLNKLYSCLMYNSSYHSGYYHKSTSPVVLSQRGRQLASALMPSDSLAKEQALRAQLYCWLSFQSNNAEELLKLDPVNTYQPPSRQDGDASQCPILLPTIKQLSRLSSKLDPDLAQQLVSHNLYDHIGLFCLQLLRCCNEASA